MRKPLTWILIGGLAVLVGAGLGAALDRAVGRRWRRWSPCSGRHRDRLRDRRLEGRRRLLRGLRRAARPDPRRARPLPAATPLLRKGDDRYAERTLTGPLADGVDGTLALYTYEDETTDSDGNRQTNYYHYTLGLVEVPECVAHVPELYCQRKFGLRALEKFEDVFRRSKERVKLESEALDEKYEIFAGKGQDAELAAPASSPPPSSSG